MATARRRDQRAAGSDVGAGEVQRGAVYGLRWADCEGGTGAGVAVCYEAEAGTASVMFMAEALVFRLHL